MLSMKLKPTCQSPETFTSTAEAPPAAENTSPAARIRMTNLFMTFVLPGNAGI